ncbi:MAG: acyl-CoA dehydrogenase family protein [Flavobacteriales bacterium]|nr:acyl-CoA dehydrogenase family protein [Flavobacteriales bacterium]
MMFTSTENPLILRPMLRDLYEPESQLRLMERDENQRFPEGSARDMASNGMYGVLVPEEYGGVPPLMAVPFDRARRPGHEGRQEGEQARYAPELVLAPSQERDYKEMIELLNAQRRRGLSNVGHEHAACVLAAMIEKACNSLQMFENRLDGEVTDGRNTTNPGQ